MKIIDFKLKFVETEIEIAFRYYPENYKKILAIPELRQKLISYVYPNISGTCLVIEWENKRLPIKENFAFNSQELGLKIEAFVYQGIEKIFEENKELLTQKAI